MLKIEKLLALLVIILLLIALFVVRVLKHLLDAASDTLVLPLLVLPDVLVDLEEDHFECWLLLNKVQDLEILLIELGLRLVAEQFEVLGGLLIVLDHSCSRVQAENYAKDLLEGPNHLEEEHEDSDVV